LGAGDFVAIERRRGGANQLGFALQLCAFRYPGRVLRQGEAIPEAALASGRARCAHMPRDPKLGANSSMGSE
jgi:TnpA family transposase